MKFVDQGAIFLSKHSRAKFSHCLMLILAFGSVSKKDHQRPASTEHGMIGNRIVPLLVDVESCPGCFLQAAEKRPSAALLSSFVVAAYIQVRLTPQDCLPERQVKGLRAPCIWAFLSSLRKMTFSGNC
jgi:hypothetical protein